MLKPTVVNSVGIDHYRDACASARRDAEREDYGRGEPGTDDSSSVPHEVADALWGSEDPVEKKIEALFEIYDEMPAYGLVMYVSGEYSAWPPQARQQFWNGVRARLASPDRALARPLAYSLWCDWFEHGDYTVEAWEAVTTVETPEPALREVLIASGPVPWHLKVRLFSRLVDDPSWHYFIFRSLLHSAFDVFGKYEAQEARAWLQRLSLPASTEHLDKLTARLRDS